MRISECFNVYFNSINELRNYKKNNITKNLLNGLSILSYFTLVIPAGITVLYGMASLRGRVNAWLVPNKKALLIDILNVYYSAVRPNLNFNNLYAYFLSDAFHEHARSARIYYNAAQLDQTDALKIISQREPVNMCCQRLYDIEGLKKLFGYEKSIYNDTTKKKADESSFTELPNTAAVYSETYLWKTPGNDTSKKEIACLSLPAPALDNPFQPHYEYYVTNGTLDVGKYQQEMHFLFDIITQSIKDNVTTAFSGKGIKRVVLSKFGIGAFITGLPETQREKAIAAYQTALQSFLIKIRQTHPNLKIVMSVYQEKEKLETLTIPTIVGDIIKTAEKSDLIINPWDPHSAPGNGNDGDTSFDEAMGKASGILLTQTAWLNPHLKTAASTVKVRPSK